MIFDLDGTLTPVGSIWRYLHEALGTWQIGKYSAEQYWSGLIDYETWARHDAEAWRSIDIATVKQIVGRIPYSEGARETVTALRHSGIATGLVTAGLSLLAQRAERELGIDFVVANQLLYQDGKLTGEVVVRVPLEDKQTAMHEMADRLGISLRNCAAIGDTSYDLPLGLGLRIAFNSTDENARQIADVAIQHKNLRAIREHLI